MIKRFMLVLAILLVSACGKKSVIKSNVEAQPLRNTISVVIPLSEKVISSFNSTTDDVNPLLRGLVNTFMNLGASMGAGLTHLTLVQPLPEIPRELVSLKIKRVFFFIEPKDKQESFKFLDMLAVKLSSANIDKTNGYEPSVDTNSKKKRKIWNYLESFFDLRSEADYVSWEKHTEGLPLIKYIQKHRRDYLINSDRRNIYLLQTKKPGETRNYLETNLGPLFDRIHNLNKSI